MPCAGPSGTAARISVCCVPFARKGFRFVGDVHVDRPAAAPAPSPRSAGQDGELSRLALPALDRAAIAVLPFTNLER